MRVMSFWGNKPPLDMHESDLQKRQKKLDFCKEIREYGDIIANLIVFEEYLLENSKHSDKRFVEDWCLQQGYDFNNLRRIEYEYKDIEKICKQLGLLN